MDVFTSSGVVPFTVGESRSREEIEESAVWQKLQETSILQFNSAVSQIKFSPVAPFSIVSLSGLSGPWIDGQTHDHTFSFAKTKTPFSAVAFRSDGVLIALGREDGTVDIYPVSDHQTLLRRFKLKSGVVFSLAFSPFANQVIAGTGDGKIHIIDVSQREDVKSINAHSDAVTAVLPLESGNMWVSASHDATIKIWDLGKMESVSTINTSDPISRMVIHGGRVFAAAGDSVIVANVQSNPGVVSRFVAHTRPIVGMSIVRSNLVTASPDRTIKVFDPSTFALKYVLKMFSDISAFDAKPDASAIAVALSGGTVQVKYVAASNATETKKVAELPANFRIFKRQVPKRNEEWNRAIRKYEFGQALDLTIQKGDPSIVVGMIDELDKLGSLEIALAGRDPPSLQPVLEFLLANVTNPLWSHIILRAVVAVEKIYRQVIGDVPSIGKLFEKLCSIIDQELETQQRAAKLAGKIDLLLNHP